MVVFGGGMIGLCALIVCKAAHANVIMVEPLPNRQEYAKRFGADAVIDPRQVKSLADEIARYTARKRGATVVVEASGNDNAIASLFEVAGLQPRMRLIGHSVGRKVPVEIGKTIWKGISIYGQGGISYDMPRTITFMDRIRKHVDLSQLISHRFTFNKLHEAMETAVHKKAEALKVMLAF